MIVIGLCDADQTVRIQLNEYIRRYQKENDSVIQILSYSSGETLLKNYMLEFDLIFLEIPFRRLNGIEIARRVRTVDKNVRIVFLTTLLSHVLEAYEVNASNYLIKPLSYARFCSEMGKLFLTKQPPDGSRFFIEKNDHGIYKIYLSSILYIETGERRTFIHTSEETIVSMKSMKMHEAALPPEVFVRCHTGFLINLRYFDKYEKNELVLTGGTRIPVSRYKKSLLFERLKNYYGEADL